MLFLWSQGAEPMRLNKNILKTKIHKTNKWTKKPSKNAKLLKNIRMKKLKNQMGDDLYEYFSAQQHNVLDEIIYKSVETGVYVAHISTLQKNVIKVKSGKRGVSGSTIKKTIRAMRLHAKGEFYIGQIANGHLGAYVFVDLCNAKASTIMAQLFGVMVSTTSVNNVLEAASSLEGNISDSVVEKPTDVEKNVPKQPVKMPSAIQAKVLPKSLYGRICTVLNIFTKNKVVTDLMTIFEKAKKELIGLDADYFMYAIEEAIRYKAKNIPSYVFGILYGDADKETKNFAAMPKLKMASKNLPEWYVKGIHEQHAQKLTGDDLSDSIKKEIELIEEEIKKPISDYVKKIYLEKINKLNYELANS